MFTKRITSNLRHINPSTLSRSGGSAHRASRISLGDDHAPPANGEGEPLRVGGPLAQNFGIQFHDDQKGATFTNRLTLQIRESSRFCQLLWVWEVLSLQRCPSGWVISSFLGRFQEVGRWIVGCVLLPVTHHTSHSTTFGNIDPLHNSN